MGESLNYLDAEAVKTEVREQIEIDSMNEKKSLWNEFRRDLK